MGGAVGSASPIYSNYFHKLVDEILAKGGMDPAGHRIEDTQINCRCATFSKDKYDWSKNNYFNELAEWRRENKLTEKIDELNKNIHNNTQHHTKNF